MLVRASQTPAEPNATLETARRALAKAFRAAGLDTPDLDARLLVGHALGLDHAQLAAAAGRILTAPERAAIEKLAQRRLAREPVARILGWKEFWGLKFQLSPDTLVPRPETEIVVEAALTVLADAGAKTLAPRIADLGTGSGALLLALLSEMPAAHGIGTDLSPGALATARDNAARLGLAARAEFIACDYARALTGQFDCIVANPPYVATGDIAALAPEVREHDPLAALDGGADGLDGYRAIARDTRRLLGPQGVLVVELGAGQSEAVAAIMAAKRLACDRPARCDLAGIPRALILRPLP